MKRGDSVREAALKVALALRKEKLRLATAESCTGGWIAKACTDLPGSSQWFEGSFVTYSGLAKKELLGVREETLASKGEVSEEVVREMALGAMARLEAASIVVAVSGVAGPGGGENKPVGLVCFAWQKRDLRIISREQFFTGDREEVRRKSVVEALNGVARLTVAQ